MKEFFKYVFATIVGLIIMGIICTVVGVVSIVGLVASADATQGVKNHSVLVLDLSGAITEQTKDNPIANLIGTDVSSQGLNDMLSAIKKAGRSSKIDGIYIEAGMLSAGYSSLKELRDALADFKETGKWIVAYGNSYTQGAYYVASLADSIYLNPNGQVDLHGIASQTVYMKDLYEKFGIKFQIFKVGKFKSATEVYSEDRMSDANREQMNAIVTGVWSEMKNAIAASRNLSPDTIDVMADSFTAFRSEEDILQAGLVDGLLYSDEMKSRVKRLLGIRDRDEINQLSVMDMRSVRGNSGGEQIAVYYAEGAIMDSRVENIPLVSGEAIIGDDMCKDLDKLMKDDDVKAVVLRVNSPGGSAYSSEQIWHSVAMLKEKKPVVVSMGDYAASGGYYISCDVSWIVAQPTTLTGSIGIFAVVPEASELLTKKLSLHFDGVKTNKHSDLGSSMYSFAVRPFDGDEAAMLQGYIERGYSLFCQRVADGRGQTVEQIGEIAQGHVWLGQDAIGIGLVDELGGLDDAIAKAAELAQLEDYYTTEYPAEPSWLNLLLDVEGNDNYLDERLRGILGEWYLPFVYLKSATEQDPIQARMPYLLMME